MDRPPLQAYSPQPNLLVGAGVPNADQIRCQLTDDTGNFVIMNRGENTDVTFSDAGKGAWSFMNFKNVVSVNCSPDLPKAGPDDFKLNVRLTDVPMGASEDNRLPAGGTVSITESSGTLWDTVELIAGSQVPDRETTRCQVLDASGLPLTVLRGTNRDVTFSDAEKGPWTFEVGATEVSKIVCDTRFVKGSA